MAIFISRLKQILNLQTKTVTATTSQQTVTPDTGYNGMVQVTVNPQAHTGTAIPTADTAAFDMGENHAYRYIDTSGMITPSGTKQINYNGTGIDVAEYANVDVAVPSSGGNLQSNKTVTATTSQQVVTPDQGYDGLEQVTVNPQVHTATYTPADDTAANDMGVNNNYRYVDTSGMVAPTSITPSNWSPAEMTTGNAYTPSANAFAIEYGKLQQATPSNSSPVSVSGGIAYNIGPSSSASGYLIESYSNLAPSDSSPATITSGDIYKATASGKAVASVTDITPSNSSPVSLSSGTIYKPSASGYAISSYSSVTPSDSTPPQLSQGNLYEPTANGYLYASNQSPTETVLWTNGSPTSTFANQTVTLSDNISDYDYLCFEYRSTTGSSAKTSKVFVKTTDFITAGSGANTCQLGTYARNSSDVGYTRVATYASDTTITFSHSIRAGSSGQDDTSAIPTKIVGISVALPPSVGNVKTGVINHTGGTTETFTCGFKPKKIFIYNYYSANKYVSVTYDEDTSDTYQYMGYRSSSSGGGNCNKYTIGDNTNGTIQSITSTGFSFKASSTYTPLYYVAIG